MLDIIQLFDYGVFGFNHHGLLASDLFQLILKTCLAKGNPKRIL
jgi:hypothetical protein